MNDLFYFIVIDIKLALWNNILKKTSLVKYDSVDWLITDSFYLIIWYYAGSCFNCYYFCRKEIGVCKPLFSQLFYSQIFLKYYMYKMLNMAINMIISNLKMLVFLKKRFQILLKLSWPDVYIQSQTCHAWTLEYFGVVVTFSIKENWRISSNKHSGFFL